jgi:perosamine synthetase
MEKWPKQIGVGAVSISEQAKRYVNEALANNRLSYGPFSRKFEAGFAKDHDCKHAVFTNSGTSSLQIALAVLKERHAWEDGDEVLCPSTTFIATSNIILQNNMKPVFVDVDRETYNVDPAQIEQHITPRTKCVIVVHLYGHPADMDPILALCKKHNLRLIEDSCETMYARYKGKSVGSFGDIGCFSTYAAHILVTGVGGLTTTNDDKLAVMLRSCMNHGRDSIYLSIDDDKGKQGDDLRMVMERRFRFVRMGYSYRCTELEAALGCAQIEEAEKNIATRRANAQKLLQRLSPYRRYLQLPVVKPQCDHSFMMFTIVVQPDAPFTREDFTLYLEEHNIETRTMVSILDQPYYHELFGKDIEEQYPVAKWIDRSGLYIGCHMELGDDEINYIGDVIEEFLSSRGLA